MGIRALLKILLMAYLNGNGVSISCLGKKGGTGLRF